MKNTILMAAVTAVMASASGLALSAEETKRAAEPSAAMTTSTPDRTQSMQRLTEAAQRLRESIQEMAQQPPGDARSVAIEMAHDALLETQQAMIYLPPDLRTRGGKHSEAEYSKAMDKLKQAAQRLRESAQAMAQKPTGAQRNQAIEQVNGAILEINQAMVQLPWQPSGSATKQNSASSAFDRMDKNRDGMISRDEYKQNAGSSMRPISSSR